MRSSILVEEVTRAINSKAKPEYHVKFKLNEATGDYEFEDPSSVNYSSICYLIALNIVNKAVKLQSDNGITGFQHGIIARLVTELVNDRVLTPIEDKDDEWQCINEYYGEENEKTGKNDYQSKRYASLFKHVSPTGEITYDDIDRFAYREEGCGCWNGSVISNIGEKLYGPITLPYMPKETIIFDAVTFDSVTARPGEYDTMCIYNAKDLTLFLDDNGNELSKDEFISRYDKYCKIANDNGYEVKTLDMNRIK